MKLVVSCGGTGGHIMPALAIADTVRRNMPRAMILFVGARGGMEEELVKKAGYPIKVLDVSGLIRRPTLKNIDVLLRARRAVKEAEDLLRDFAPDFVCGTGGYASFPTILAAARLSIPCAVHESNAVPGLAVRRLARRVDLVWLNFESAAKLLPRGVPFHVVGNPMRGVWQPPTARETKRKTVLAFGGSLGAEKLNDAVIELMRAAQNDEELSVVLATGKRDFERVGAVLKEKGLFAAPRFRVEPFLYEMAREMANADLVVCRAGAVTLSELSAARRPAILVPSPNVTGDHQRKNAEAMTKKGAAVMLEESDLAGGALTNLVYALLCDDARRAEISEKIGGFFHECADKAIYEDILKLRRS